ncbi:MAG: PgdA-like protein [Ramlibacter sp.]|jgi:poly-beta-1,6-N-acetyl-D-glucosamine biosynthesis protein PgaD|nr:PgdA-like protein [Ramlibacter sp.]
MSADDASRRKARRGAMPIIDGARVPLRQLRAQAPRRAIWLFAWLKILRPLLVAALWLLAARYVARRWIGAPDELSLWQQGTLYGAALLAIVATMLVLVRLRHRQAATEAPSSFSPSTLGELSSLTNVPEEELEQWQQAQRLLVHHDADGQVQAAVAPPPPPSGG